MEKLFACLLAFITAGNLMKEVLSNPCKSSGFAGCQCNILGACGITPTDPMLKGYAPSGLSLGNGLPMNVAYLCEGGTVAIMYDCNKRIPIYSATMMEGWQLNGGKVIRPSTFTPSNDILLDKEYQQNDYDYVGSSNVEVCYDTQLGDRKVDFQWYISLNPGKTLPSTTPTCNLFHGKKKTAIHRGHLIAASYGRGDPKRTMATFTYTNVVPQFGPFNSGKWCSSERRIRKWGLGYCTSHNSKATKNVNIYIIVGVIPSTFGSSDPRYFGSADKTAGFSNYLGGKYRVNVPSIMWTAACCMFQFQDGDGSWKDGISHTAFLRENNPSKEKCDTSTDINQFFGSLKMQVNLFPAHPGCSDPSNRVFL